MPFICDVLGRSSGSQLGDQSQFIGVFCTCRLPSTHAAQPPPAFQLVQQKLPQTVLAKVHDGIGRRHHQGLLETVDGHDRNRGIDGYNGAERL